jgi:tetratricopeptide (TPR) repeat protein
VENPKSLLVALALNGDAYDLQDLSLIEFDRERWNRAVILSEACAALDTASVHCAANTSLILSRLGRCIEASDAYKEAKERLQNLENLTKDGEDYLEYDRDIVQEAQTGMENCFLDIDFS